MADISKRAPDCDVILQTVQNVGNGNGTVRIVAQTEEIFSPAP